MPYQMLQVGRFFAELTQGHPNGAHDPLGVFQRGATALG